MQVDSPPVVICVVSPRSPFQCLHVSFEADFIVDYDARSAD